MNFLDRIQQFNLEQFKNSSNFNKIIGAFASRCDDIQTQLNKLEYLLNIDNAIGAQLDLIGSIVVQARNGLDDASYKEAIKIKIFKNTSKGFVDDIVHIIHTITNANTVVYSDNPPASYTLYTDGLIIPKRLKQAMKDVSAAGVSLDLYSSQGIKPIILYDLITNQSLDRLVDNKRNSIVDNNGNNIVVNSKNINNQQIVLTLENNDVLLNEDNSLILDEKFIKNVSLNKSSVDTYQLFQGGNLNVVGQANLVDNLGNRIVTNNGLVVGVNYGIVGEERLVVLVND